ncbi:protein RETICULATA-RELATED 4 [Forsythia ovata]|uniref:Protein RETICULATA-RELATED 4 n=1 Tax=Forsythia ovata TaxID=205694 RepID=A0ABD1T5F5_9LAMI
MPISGTINSTAQPSHFLSLHHHHRHPSTVALRPFSTTKTPPLSLSITPTHRRLIFLPFFTNFSVTNTNIITNVSNVSGNTRISEGSNDDDRCGGKGGDENGNNWNDESNRKKNRDEALMALVEAEKGLETCSRS